LLSIDDFYLLSSGLVVTETTNNIFNESLYVHVTTETVLSWIRTIVANRMATSGSEWTQIFAKYNSGTYNNQWMVVDYNLFTPGEELPSNTLWILEQIPGYCHSADVTSVMLSNGAWVSYNIPYFVDIYDLSGYAQMETEYGTQYSYSQCPRATIFKRDHPQVNSLSAVKWIIRYNDWQNDPLSLGDAANSICSRFDLSVNTPAAFGGIDSKVTSYQLLQDYVVQGISGPTYYEQQAFEWTGQWETTPHYGQPNKFYFDWEFFTMENISMFRK